MLSRSLGWAAALILVALLSSECLAARVRTIDAELLAASDKLSGHNDQESSGRLLLEVPGAADPWGAPAPGYGTPAPYNGYYGYYGAPTPSPYGGYYGYGYNGAPTPSPSYTARRMVAEAPSYGPTPSPAGYGYGGYGYNGYGYNGYYGYGYFPVPAPYGAAPSTRRMAMTTSSRRVAAAGHNLRGWGATSHLRRFMLDTPGAVPAPMDAPSPSYGAPAPYNGYNGYYGYGYYGGYGYNGAPTPSPYGGWY